MKIESIGLLLFMFVGVTRSGSFIEEMPIMDLREGSHENENAVHELKVEGVGKYFEVLLTTNPSTGYRWWAVSNSRSNCISKIQRRAKAFKKPNGPKLMGQPI